MTGKSEKHAMSDAELIAHTSGRSFALLKEILAAQGKTIEVGPIIVGVPKDLFKVNVAAETGKIVIQRYEH